VRQTVCRCGVVCDPRGPTGSPVTQLAAAQKNALTGFSLRHVNELTWAADQRRRRAPRLRDATGAPKGITEPACQFGTALRNVGGSAGVPSSCSSL
jgi:hypothetical protein